MDITFKCPKCEQELEVDAAGVGSEIDCPACQQTIVIPNVPPPEEAAPEAAAPPPPSGGKTDAPKGAKPPEKSGSPNPMAASAGSKEDKHFAVPMRDGPAEVLIRKANRPLEIAAKDSDRKMRIKVIRRADCIELGKDKFEDTVTELIAKIGEQFILSMHPVSYSFLDPGTQKLLSDFGVIIVYRG